MKKIINKNPNSLIAIDWGYGYFLVAPKQFSKENKWRFLIVNATKPKISLTKPAKHTLSFRLPDLDINTEESDSSSSGGESFSLKKQPQTLQLQKTDRNQIETYAATYPQNLFEGKLAEELCEQFLKACVSNFIKTLI